MKDFDIKIGRVSKLKPSIMHNSNENYFSFEGDLENKKSDKTWIDTINALTKEFKSSTGYKTNEEYNKRLKNYLEGRGYEYKIAGFNPITLIGISFGFVIISSVVLLNIKS